MWVQLANRDILFILLYMFMCSIFTKLLQITTLETFKVVHVHVHVHECVHKCSCCVCICGECHSKVTHHLNH